MSPLDAVSRGLCRRVHLGPVRGYDRKTMSCTCCGKPLTTEDRHRYFALRAQVMDLQADALRVAWRPPA